MITNTATEDASVSSTNTDYTQSSLPLSQNPDQHESQVDSSRTSPYISVVRDSVEDIWNSTTNLNQSCLLKNTKNSYPDDDKALRIHKQVTSFDQIVDKALGRFSKNAKKLSPFGKPNKNYSFIRAPNFDNILLPLFKSDLFSLQDLHNLRYVEYIHCMIICTKQFTVLLT